MRKNENNTAATAIENAVSEENKAFAIAEKAAARKEEKRINDMKKEEEKAAADEKAFTAAAAELKDAADKLIDIRKKAVMIQTVYTDDSFSAAAAYVRMMDTATHAAAMAAAAEKIAKEGKAAEKAAAKEKAAAYRKTELVNRTAAAIIEDEYIDFMHAHAADKKAEKVLNDYLYFFSYNGTKNRFSLSAAAAAAIISTFEKYRINGNFSTAYDGIAHIIRDELSTDTIYIRIKPVQMNNLFDTLVSELKAEKAGKYFTGNIIKKYAIKLDGDRATGGKFIDSIAAMAAAQIAKKAAAIKAEKAAEKAAAAIDMKTAKQAIRRAEKILANFAD